jgi:3-oxoacyl-[acyl-carrier-protein] synthase II
VVTPLGNEPSEIILSIDAGQSAAASPTNFDASPFDCPLCAEIVNFDAEADFPGNKTLRMMNRDAQLAVVAARRAIQNASLKVGDEYLAEDIGLFGSTGLAGMPIADIDRLVKNSADREGKLDLERFGREAMKRVRPVLSFKLLANMPICFVSIFEGICGPNTVYTPWEGQGARAIVAGVMAIRSGRVQCALVGGCDAKAHVLGFISLQQQGVFRSWRETGSGTIPGEGAAFLVLENEESARARGANIYARITGWDVRTKQDQNTNGDLFEVMASLGSTCPSAVIAGADSSPEEREVELKAIADMGGSATRIMHPKDHVSNIFAAAAALQVSLAAQSCRSLGRGFVWANCLGHGSELGSFSLEAV